MPSGVDHAELAVVEVHLVVLVHQAHVVRLVRVGVGHDQIDVVLVLQDDVVEDLQAELGELDRLVGDLDDPLLVVAGLSALATPPGKPSTGWITLPPAMRHQVASRFAHADDFLADLDADLAEDAENVALGLRGVGPDDEIGPAEEVEVQGVVFDHEGVVDQFADFLAGRRRPRPCTGRPAPWSRPCDGPSGRRRRCAT